MFEVKGFSGQGFEMFRVFGLGFGTGGVVRA